MYTDCVFRSTDKQFKDVILRDGKPTFIGRSAETAVKDLRCSKRQLEVTANFEKGTVRVVNIGSNDSEVNEEILRNRESRIIKNGDKIRLLKDKHEFSVIFEKEPEPVVPGKRKREDEKEKSYSDNAENDSDDGAGQLKKTRETMTLMKSSFNNLFKLTGSSDVTHKGSSTVSDSWVEIVPQKLFHFKTSGIKIGPKIASFDLDGTIITTKSGKVFPVNVSDWKILFPQITSKLREIFNDGYQIVLFTNQKGISRGNLKPTDFQKKLQDIAKSLAVPLQAFVSSGSGVYRKPLRGMWDHFIQKCNGNITVDMNKSFYIGDAAGRPANWEPKRKKDFSCSDRLFAFNCRLKFLTPEEYFLNQRAAPYNLPEFDPKKHGSLLAKCLEPSQKEYSEKDISQQPELIVLVGFPGSGKSFFAKKYLVTRGYVHINRDTLGTQQKCQALCDSALTKGGSVVVDNTNPDKESRKRYIELAKKHKVSCRCFLFQCDINQAQHNITFRELTSSDHAKVNIMILNSYKSKFEQPTLSEGFSEIVLTHFVPSFKSESDEKLYKMYLT